VKGDHREADVKRAAENLRARLVVNEPLRFQQDSLVARTPRQLCRRRQDEGESTRIAIHLSRARYR
jgi:hypothetical protein